MKKILITLAVFLAMLPVVANAENLVKSYHDGRDSREPLDIDIWIDNDDGIYYEGEEITIYFRANYDCYVALYSIDTRGYVSLLSPTNYRDNGFIQGGETYAIPGSYDEYDLIVSGPEGIEHIQAIASFEELDIPDWFDGSPLKVDTEDDREDFIEYVNNRYFDCRGRECERAFDYTSIYVKKQGYYYKPVYYPTTWYDTPYYSMVYFDYPYGAEIYIDGLYFGIAPLWIPRVMFGWRYVTIYDHYGHCWEQNIHFEHNQTIYLDRTRVKTTRSTVSRFKDVRKQVTKYKKTNYVLSDKRVKTVRGASNSVIRKNGVASYKKGTEGSGVRTGTDKWTGKRPSNKGSSGKSDYRGQSTSGESSGDYKRSSGSKSTKLGNSNSRGSSKRGESDYKKSSGSKKSGSSYRPSGSTKSSGSSKISTGSKKSSGTVKKSGDSKRSSPPAKSTGTVKNSGGSKKSSPPAKSGGSIKKSEGSNKKSGGSVKRSSSGSSNSSSVGRSGSSAKSSGRSTSVKSSSSKSSSGKSGSRGSGKRR